VEVVLGANYQIEVMMGSQWVKNQSVSQSANFSLSINNDNVYVASSLCTTCQNKFFSQANSSTDIVTLPNQTLVNTDFTNCTEEYGRIDYTGAYILDLFYLKSAKDALAAKANATKMPFFLVQSFTNENPILSN
jgi:hypothetical protein